VWKNNELAFVKFFIEDITNKVVKTSDWIGLFIGYNLELVEWLSLTTDSWAFMQNKYAIKIEDPMMFKLVYVRGEKYMKKKHNMRSSSRKILGNESRSREVAIWPDLVFFMFKVLLWELIFMLCSYSLILLIYLVTWDIYRYCSHHLTLLRVNSDVAGSSWWVDLQVSNGEWRRWNLMVYGVVDKFIGCCTIGEEVDAHPWFMVLTIPLVRGWCSSLVYSARFTIVKMLMLIFGLWCLFFHWWIG